MIKFLFRPGLQDTGWKYHPELRKYYVHELFKNTDWLGKSKSEIKSFLGKYESGERLAYCLCYYVETRSGKKYYLIFDFKEDRVVRVRYKFKKIL